MALPEKLTIGEAVRLRIDDLCRLNFRSYRRLAAAAHVPKSTLMDFMDGRVKNLNIENTVLIANAFGMSYREFTDCDYFDRIDVLKLVEEKGN